MWFNYLEYIPGFSIVDTTSVNCIGVRVDIGVSLPHIKLEFIFVRINVNHVFRGWRMTEKLLWRPQALMEKWHPVEVVLNVVVMHKLLG